MAGMEDGAERVGAVRQHRRPGLACRRLQRTRHGRERAAHVSGMRGAVDQVEALDPRQHARDAIVDRDMRRKADVPVQQHASRKADLEQRDEPVGAIGQQLGDVRDLELRGVAGRHDVGHVHVAGWAPGDDRVPPVLFCGLVEPRHGAARHVARRMRLVVMGGAAAIRRSADRVHVVAHAFQQHDRQPDHLGMAKHVAAEPEGDAIIAHSQDLTARTS